MKNFIDIIEQNGNCATIIIMLFCHCPVPKVLLQRVSLHSVLLDCEVKEALATFTVTQRFVNETQQLKECMFKFPNDEDSVITKLIITLDNGRVFTSQVNYPEETKVAHSDEVSSSHNAVIVNIGQEKDFNLRVGNLAPNSGLEITLEIVAPLKCSGNKWLFSVPQWLIPAWDKPPIQGHEFKALMKEERREKFGFSLRIVQTAEIRNVVSAGARGIEVTFDQLKHEAEVALTPSSSQGAINIEFETSEDFKPQIQVEYDAPADEYIGMLSFIPPLQASGESISDSEGTGDFIFMINRSKSMAGTSIEMAKKAAIIFVKSLSEGNKFNIVSFGSEFEKMFEKSQIVNSANVWEAVNKVKSFSADMGGRMNILSPLREIYSEVPDPMYPRSIFLLTDGGVVDKNSVISLIEANSKQTRANAFGIGDCVDRLLILDVSKASGGRAEFISDPSDVKKMVSTLKTTSLFSLSNPQIMWPSQTYEQFPSNKFLRVCYYGELLVAFVNFGKKKPEANNAKLQALNTENRLEMTWEIAIDKKISVGTGLKKLWAKHAIRELTFDHKEALRRVKAVSKLYGVPSEFTAFLCVAEDYSSFEPGMYPGVGYIIPAMTSQMVPSYHPPPPQMRTQQSTPLMLRKPGMPPSLFMKPGTPNMPQMPPDVTPMPEGFPAMSEGQSPKSLSAVPFQPPPSAMVPPHMMIPQRSSGFSGPQPMPSGLPFKLPRAMGPPPSFCAPVQVATAPPLGATNPSSETDSASSPLQLPAPITSTSLINLIFLQETSGKWLTEKVTVNCPIPDDFQYPDAGDVWTTLCVVVVIEAKFAAQAGEWEFIIRKARKVLKSAGVNIEQYRDQIKAQLGV